MEEGWIKIPRQLLVWGWFGNSKMVHVLLYMVLRAEPSRRVVDGLTLRRGQLWTSVPAMCAALGMTTQEVRTCVSRLVKEGVIEWDGSRRATRRCVVVTVRNYSRYRYVAEVAGLQRTSKRVEAQCVIEESNVPITHEERAENAPQKIATSESVEPQTVAAVSNVPTSRDSCVVDALVEKEISDVAVGQTVAATNDFAVSVEDVAAAASDKDKEETEKKEQKERSKEKKEIKGREETEPGVESSIRQGPDAFAPAPAEAAAAEEVVAVKEKAIPYRAIRDDWNRICTDFTQVRVISESRKSKIRSRVAEMGGVDAAMEIMDVLFAKMMASEFLRGRNPRGWKASFDWLFENDKNWVKVYEGNFDHALQDPPTNNGFTNTRNHQENVTTQNHRRADWAAAAGDAEFARHIARRLTECDDADENYFDECIADEPADGAGY